VRSRPVALVLVVALGAVALGACGSTSTATTTTSAPATTTRLPSAAASTTQIRHAYSVLFDLADPALAPKLAVVEGGAGLHGAFLAALHSSLAKRAGGAAVHKVTIERGAACGAELISSPCAKVTYDILSPSRAVLLPGSTGLAVYQHGRWLVARVTICTLLELENAGKVPAGC
jgi:hypothetical protein